ncbi:hypothetical protein D3C86_1516190 [compost metagenome]
MAACRNISTAPDMEPISSLRSVPEGGCDVSPAARISIFFDNCRTGRMIDLRVRRKSPAEKSTARTSSPFKTRLMVALVFSLSAEAASERASIWSPAVSIAFSSAENCRVNSGISLRASS